MGNTPIYPVATTLAEQAKQRDCELPIQGAQQAGDISEMRQDTKMGDSKTQRWAEGGLLLQAKLEDSELQVKELSRQVMALERAKVELEARNRQLESAAHTSKDAPGAGAAGPAGTPQVSSTRGLLPLFSLPWVSVEGLPVLVSFQSTAPWGAKILDGQADLYRQSGLGQPAGRRAAH